MTIEFRMLAFTVLLGLVQLLLTARAANKQRGVAWNLGPRDEKVPELTGKAGRLERSFKNLMETFPFFAAAVLMAQVANRLTPWTALGAEIYFVCRVIYVPLYVGAVAGFRTAIWCLSMIGLLMVLWPMLWPF